MISDCIKKVGNDFILDHDYEWMAVVYGISIHGRFKFTSFAKSNIIPNGKLIAIKENNRIHYLLWNGDGYGMVCSLNAHAIASKLANYPRG